MVCRVISLALCLVFLGAVARFYHPGLGFTALIGFPAGHDHEAPAMRAVPHFDYPAWASYDGQFYAQRALDPLVRDPRVDRAMDLAPFRARRILFSWTAFALGLGRPVWIIEAYALQNVLAWLVLAALLTRWLPLGTWRGLALWTACLFSHGLLWSTRFALLDGPSLVLAALAVLLVERRRPLASALVAGLSGLARETNLLAFLVQPVPSSWREARRLVVAAALVVLPLLVWEDYLWSIYRSTVFAGADQLSMPGAAPAAVVWRVLSSFGTRRFWGGALMQLCIVLPLLVQACYVLVHPQIAKPWWRLAAGYVLLLAVMNAELWNPATGAITRVMLPLTVGFNVLLTGEPRPARFWPWFALGNLHLVPAIWVMPMW